MTTIISRFTLEEIYLINTCKAANKTENIKELEEYLRYVDADMAEIVHSAMEKLRKVSDKEYLDLRNYPE